MCLIQRGADLERDFGRPAQRLMPAFDRPLDRGERLLGRRQQRLAFAAAFAGEVRIAADDQPLVRIIGRRDRRHVALVEQIELQGAALGQRLDRRRPQAGDPVEPGRLQLVVDAGLRDHAAVADQHHVLEGEAPLQLLDLCGERLRVGGRTVEHLDGDGAAVGGAQQAVDDLQLAFLAVAVVTERRELAAPSLQIARRDVVEHQRAVLEMPLRQRRLDRRLAFGEPVERGVEFVLVDRAQAQHDAETVRRRRRIERPGRRQLRRGCQQPGDDHRQHQIAAAIALRPEQPIEADRTHCAEHRGDVAVRQRPADRQRLRARRQHVAALQKRTQTFDEVRRPVGQVAERPLPDPSLLAIRLPQQNGGRRVRGSARPRCTWPHNRRPITITQA